MSEVKVDTISERTAAGGVTIDGVLVKDGVATFQTPAGSPLVFEGATANAFETTFAITDPTADRTITFPDASITLGAAKDNLPAFYVQFTGGDQTLVDAAITLIEWNTEIYDTASGYNITGTGDNPRSYTVQSGGAGKWFLSWGVYTYTSGGGNRAVQGGLYKNGSDMQTSAHSSTVAPGWTGVITMAGSVVLELVEDDYVSVYGLVDVHTGTPRIASHAGATWFSGFRLAE
jgi:hypothetical protein